MYWNIPFLSDGELRVLHGLLLGINFNSEILTPGITLEFLGLFDLDLGLGSRFLTLEDKSELWDLAPSRFLRSIGSDLDLGMPELE